ncbi:TPA_exp: Uncharacterized protein A8136_5874 [Trichophyton benhamiae CBS 112371]|uniref:Uncharacterized protein n=2 Tax=Trichophyton TaxID=5550 RepID=D4APT1_ARTBC|nr:uncharacterized protein ARB_06249 [Trichophyton benhamiae CBS 112371]XP_003025018.1 uncharacterized protein TRV_00823 [Trichophyton verrucosum HKI 0517]EFE35292.1 hypothetical protein ARB_06249 [Trichophyton benhamiae CBS 112371]EFE44407.1 hypothetical protein TRV_00823 [Trichophyton verrucosum HKI 0517]DAA78171.1 TPA_exp: Uncharacterized protein A8136_5874 [Trichophyton benhamiae CBS 112371]
MEFSVMQLLLELLQRAGISVCIVGELALNYYNAPRIVHDLELCVREDDLTTAASIFQSTEILDIAPETEYNIYTEYKKGFPRFRSRSEPKFYIVLFTDRYYRLSPLEQNIISPEEHDEFQGTYSKELLDTVPAHQIATLPLPRFAPLLRGLCTIYIETREVTAAIAAEMLVDGMDIDEHWCHRHFDPSHQAVLNFALNLVRGKASRIADFSMNEVTCFIVDKHELQNLRGVPGFSRSTVD